MQDIYEKLEIMHAKNSRAGQSISVYQTQVSRWSKTADTPGNGQTNTRQPAEASSAQPRSQDVAKHFGQPKNVSNLADNNFLSHDKTLKKESSHKTVSFDNKQKK